MSEVVQFITPVFRVAFAHLWEPFVFFNQKQYNRAEATAAGLADRLAYSCIAIFPKSASLYPPTITSPELRNADFTQMQQQAFYAAMAKWPARFEQSQGQWPTGLIWPLRDGDTDPNYVGKDGFAGGLFAKLTAPVGKSGTNKPQIVDQNVQDVLDRNGVYAGCWARAYVSAYAYDNTSRGVRFTLNILQKVADGEPFGMGGAPAAQVMGAIPGAAPSAPQMPSAAPGMAPSYAPQMQNAMPAMAPSGPPPFQAPAAPAAPGLPTPPTFTPPEIG